MVLISGFKGRSKGNVFCIFRLIFKKEANRDKKCLGQKELEAVRPGFLLTTWASSFTIWASVVYGVFSKTEKIDCFY